MQRRPTARTTAMRHRQRQKSASLAQLGRNTCPIISRASAPRPAGGRRQRVPLFPIHPAHRSPRALPVAPVPGEYRGPPPPLALLRIPLGEPEIIDALVYCAHVFGRGRNEKSGRKVIAREVAVAVSVQRLVLRPHARTHARTQALSREGRESACALRGNSELPG